MSVFGGDSWGREAEYRKRRVDDVMLTDSRNKKKEDSSSSSYKKLSNGKYVCLVCPNNPLVDSSLMLSMHNKGSRHIAAESREEIKKIIGVSDGYTTSVQEFNMKGKAGVEALSSQTASFFSPNSSPIPQPRGSAGEIVAEHQQDLVNRRERELKFTASGWKRDCHGRWFRDETVEFDSDEEDPNVCLA